MGLIGPASLQGMEAILAPSPTEMVFFVAVGDEERGSFDFSGCASDGRFVSLEIMIITGLPTETVALWLLEMPELIVTSPDGVNWLFHVGSHPEQLARRHVWRERVRGCWGFKRGADFARRRELDSPNLRHRVFPDCEGDRLREPERDSLREQHFCGGWQYSHQHFGLLQAASLGPTRIPGGAAICAALPI